MTKVQIQKAAILAGDVPPRTTRSNYPAPFAERVSRRIKRPLGDFFALKNFGVNLTTLEPGGQSALLHRHSRQDEFVYILQGRAVLRTDSEEIELSPGMCAGFPAAGSSHQLINRTQEPVTYLEVGDRTPGDRGDYPEDDLTADLIEGKWQFRHKDGRPYEV